MAKDIVNGEIANKKSREREKFIIELETLIKAAKNAGFSDKDIKEITITRDGKTIVVWEFLAQEKIRERRNKIKGSFNKKKYFTVLDISDELESKEYTDLDSLREKMIFVGDENQ